MPTCKLTYWNATVLAESLRMLLHYGGQEFEDNRITREQWATLKPTSPMGQVPILEIDGKTLYQSMAIARFLGRRYGLAGNDEWENVEIDMIADTLADIRNSIAAWFYVQNEEVKAELQKKFKTETFRYTLDVSMKLQKRIMAT